MWNEHALQGCNTCRQTIGVMRAKACLGVLALLVNACTPIAHQRVEGWPELMVVEHHVPHNEMRDRCARYVGFGEVPEACAEFDLAAKRCDIWYSADFPPQRWIVQHERLHCAGYDHAGASGMRELVRQYRSGS